MSQAVEVNKDKEHSIGEIRKNYKQYFSLIEEFHAFLSEFGVKWSKNRMKSGKLSQVQDKILAQMSHALDHLIKTENEYMERLRETYVLIDPSFNGSDRQLLTNVIKKHPELKEYALFVQTASNAKKALEQEIEKKAKKVMPNFAGVVEPVIGAKLLAMAGSLKKLARMTASTIQLLGAEKALFRHLKNKKAKSPKYGVIYNSSYIQSMPHNLRGKAARVLASKLMMAARIDQYGDRDDSLRLKKELNKEMAELKKQNK